MNILFVLNSFPGLGGIETVTDALADFLGDHFKIYAFSFGGDPSVEVSSKFEKTFCCAGGSFSGNCRMYNDILRDYRIDVVINQGMYPHTTKVVFNRRRPSGIKVISVLHGMPGYEKIQFWTLPSVVNASPCRKRFRTILFKAGLFRKYNRYTGRFRRYYRKAAIKGDAVLMLTVGYIEQFVKEYGLEKYRNRISAVENPLPASCSALPVPDWDTKKNNIVYVGRLSDEKRVDVVLDVWREASRPDWHLYIVGDGPEMSALKEKAANERIGNITFAGYEKDPWKYYSEAKILLLTSRFEGFPMCLLEALKSGAVPVSYDVSAGVRSILEDGGGMLVEKDDFKGFVGAVNMLMDDEVLLRQMSVAASDKSRRYSLETIGGQWLQLLG